MAIYTGNVNRVTGLSGVDTESMIDKMMKAESAKYEKMQKQETTVTWKQEAYRQLISSMQSFQSKWFGTNKQNNLGFSTAWNNFTTSVKDSAGNDSNAISIKGSTNEGKYEIEVLEVAETESITGKGTISSEILTGKSAEEIANSINDIGELNLKFDLDGSTKEVKITREDLANATGATNSDKLQNILNDKMKESFGTVDGSAAGKNKVKVSVKGGKLAFTTGSGNALTIGNGKAVEKDTKITQAGILEKGKAGTYTLNIKHKGETYTIEAEFSADDDADKKIKKIADSFKKAKNSSGEEVDISKDISIKIDKKGDDLVFTNMSSTDNYEITSSSLGSDNLTTGKINTSNNLAYVGLDANVSTNITEKTKLSQAFGEEFKTYFEANKNSDDVLELTFGGKTITINENDTIETLTNKINSSDASFNMKFNQVTGRFKIESKQSGANGQIVLDQTTQAKEIDFLNKFMGIDVVNKDNNVTNGGAYVQGKDAKFVIDGITTTRPSNDVNMNGLEFTINGKTDGKVTIEAKTDEDATFNKLKEFVDDYNKLVTELETQISAKREKSGQYGYYEPLLPEEKEAMSEDEIKKWEEKAKTGLLYRDELLNGVLSDLRSMIYQPVDIGGKTISLYEIGIGTTSDYNTNKLEIDEEKLKKAISERGDDIAAMFTTPKVGLADKMKKVLDNSIGSNGTLRKKAGIKDTSSVTQNDLSKELQAISKRMTAEKERLYNKEMKYFQMFSQMEAMMNKQNSQMNMMMSLLGQ